MKKISLIKSTKVAGSALIITMLVIMALAVLFAGLLKSTVSEYRQVGQFEDSKIAFELAEAGIEQGLLEWRYDRNVEIPAVNTLADSPDVRRFDLTNNQITSSISPTSLPIVQSRVFDLKMYYKTKNLGDLTLDRSVSPPVINPPTNFNRIYKDQTKEFDVTAVKGSNLTLSWSGPRQDSNINSSSGNVILELKIYKTTNGAQDLVNLIIPDISEGSAVSYLDDDLYPYVCRLRVDIPGLIDDDDTYTLTITPRIGSGVNGRIVNNATDSDKFIFIKVSSDRNFDSGIHTIESTGYYHGLKRKIVTTIDRKNGTILGTARYTLYGSEFISAPTPAP